MLIHKYTILDSNNEEIVCNFDDPDADEVRNRVSEYLADYPDANLSILEESTLYSLDIVYNPAVRIREIPAVARKRSKR